MYRVVALLSRGLSRDTGPGGPLTNWQMSGAHRADEQSGHHGHPGISRREADRRAAAEMPRACPSCGMQHRDPELKGAVALGTESGPDQTSSWPAAALGAGLSGGRCTWTQDSGHAGWLVRVGPGRVVTPLASLGYHLGCPLDGPMRAKAQWLSEHPGQQALRS